MALADGLRARRTGRDAGPVTEAMPRFRRSRRNLARFWLAVGLLTLGGGAVLQFLGPPVRDRADGRTAQGNPSAEPPTGERQFADQTAKLPPTGENGGGAKHAGETNAPRKHIDTAASQAGRTTPGPIAAPDPGLLESVEEFPGKFLPRVSGDGRSPMQVYARGFDRSSLRPRVGLMIAGAGLNEADTATAISDLPAAIDLAFSPYGTHVDRLLELARIAGHEFLVSIPMEPEGYPLNDPGDHALLTGNLAAENMARLRWILSRFNGYVGATGALGTLRGERLAGSGPQIGAVTQALAGRGLLYVDPRSGFAAPSGVWGRGIDLVIDDPPTRPEIEAKLAQLEQVARDRGSALGLVGAVRPVTTDRVAAWANGLNNRGLSLAPVSALVQPPPVTNRPPPEPSK